MANIKTFEFSRARFEEIKSYPFGSNWPVVYIIENGKELYIGETVNVYTRSSQHYDNPDRRKLKKIHIITDEEYNKSATLDIESSLIQYISADGKFIGYDFRIYDDIGGMVSDIKDKNLQIGLCRIVSGYAWPWVSKNNPNKHDIQVGDVKLKWNSVNHNWVYSVNAINEVGCIHTVQGYDLNYAGVIIGPEISYDLAEKKFKVFPEKYMDINGKRGVDDIDELKRYIINIYKTLLTRGIYGTYVYIVDDGLRRYFKESFLKKS